jgi:hypothetical protein
VKIFIPARMQGASAIAGPEGVLPGYAAFTGYHSGYALRRASITPPSF